MLGTDLEALREAHQFVRDDEQDETLHDNWKVRMARKYYDQLFKEFAIVDLSRHREGKIGLRWRTEDEVLQGKGQEVCATRHCDRRGALTTVELPFTYSEQGQTKMELVKVCLCQSCGEKLNIYHSLTKTKNSDSENPGVGDADVDGAGRLHRKRKKHDHTKKKKKRRTSDS
jgi:hypothetical protein